MLKKLILVLGLLACTAMAAGVKTADTRSYKYVIFEESCFETFFTKNDFVNVPCLKLTLSKLLGTGIVVFSTILKVPQILKIVKNKSVQGLSFTAIIFETTLYLFTVSYNLYKENPFNLYGENVFIIFQNMIILSLFTTYGQNNIIKLIGTYFFLGAISAPLLLQIVPPQIYEFALIINIIIFFFSRAPQIYSNFKNRSTGQLAALTIFLNFSGAAARTFTIFTEAPDFLVLVNNFEAVLLNGIILSQIFIFWNNTPKVKHD